MVKSFIELVFIALIIILFLVKSISNKKKTQNTRIGENNNSIDTHIQVKKTPEEMMSDLQAKKIRYEEELPILEKQLAEEQEKYYSAGSALCQEIGHAYIMRHRDDFNSYEKQIMAEEEKRFKYGLPAPHPTPRVEKYEGTCPICNEKTRSVSFFGRGKVSEHFKIPADKAWKKIDKFKKENATSIEKIEKLRKQISEHEKFLLQFPYEFKKLCERCGHEFEIIEETESIITRRCKICGETESELTEWGKKNNPYAFLL